VLAGLNRLYYSPFQFKRLRRFTARMAIAPVDLADRCDALLRAETSAAVAQVEGLVQETVFLVQAHMPQVDTSTVQQRLGWRQRAWMPPPRAS
jgi:hypothetical protein